MGNPAIEHSGRSTRGPDRRGRTASTASARLPRPRMNGKPSNSPERYDVAVTDAESCAQPSAGTDERLIAAKSGDINAYTELFEECRPELLKYLRSKMADLSDDPEDVVQQVYVNAWNAIQGRDPSEDLNLIAYLKVAAWHEIQRLRDIANKKFPLPLSDDEAAFKEAPSVWDPWDDIEDWIANDERNSINREARRARKEGDEEKLGELRNEWRRSYREVEKPDE